MLLRRYGTTVQSVEADFRPHALNEINFRRDRAHSVSAEDFASGYVKVEESELAAAAAGDVHNEVEEAILGDLLKQIEARLGALADGEVLVVENENGVDWPRTRQKTRTVVVDGENRLHFEVEIRPALRLGRYRKG